LCCSVYCLCVNVYCHRVTTQLQLINILLLLLYKYHQTAVVSLIQQGDKPSASCLQQPEEFID
jgi:hypothetical protein